MVLHQISELVFTVNGLLHLVRERITKDASLPIRAWLVPVWFRHMGGLCIRLLASAKRYLILTMLGYLPVAREPVARHC